MINPIKIRWSSGSKKAEVVHGPLPIAITKISPWKVHRDFDPNNLELTTTASIVKTLKSSAVAITGEMDYLYCPTITPKSCNHEFTSIAIDSKHHLRNDKIRELIYKVGKPRRKHPLEPRDIENEGKYVDENHEDILELQTGIRRIELEPPKKVILTTREGGGFHVLLSTNHGLKTILIPQFEVEVKHHTVEELKEFSRYLSSSYPTRPQALANNPVFKARVQQARKNLGLDLAQSADVSPDTQNNSQEFAECLRPPPLQLIDETAVERAIRLAKERYEGRKVRSRLRKSEHDTPVQLNGVKRYPAKVKLPLVKKKQLPTKIKPPPVTVKSSPKPTLPTRLGILKQYPAKVKLTPVKVKPLRTNVEPPPVTIKPSPKPTLPTGLDILKQLQASTLKLKEFNLFSRQPKPETPVVDQASTLKLKEFNLFSRQPKPENPVVDQASTLKLKEFNLFSRQPKPESSVVDQASTLKLKEFNLFSRQPKPETPVVDIPIVTALSVEIVEFDDKDDKDVLHFDLGEDMFSEFDM